MRVCVYVRVKRVFAGSYKLKLSHRVGLDFALFADSGITGTRLELLVLEIRLDDRPRRGEAGRLGVVQRRKNAAEAAGLLQQLRHLVLFQNGIEDANGDDLEDDVEPVQLLFGDVAAAAVAIEALGEEPARVREGPLHSIKKGVEAPKLGVADTAHLPPHAVQRLLPPMDTYVSFSLRLPMHKDERTNTQNHTHTHTHTHTHAHRRSHTCQTPTQTKHTTSTRTTSMETSGAQARANAALSPLCDSLSVCVRVELVNILHTPKNVPVSLCLSVCNNAMFELGDGQTPIALKKRE